MDDRQASFTTASEFPPKYLNFLRLWAKKLLGRPECPSESRLCHFFNLHRREISRAARIRVADGRLLDVRIVRNGLCRANDAE
jgi:hypothetical protein